MIIFFVIAMAAKSDQGGSPLATIIAMILIGALIYYFIIRPHQKLKREHRQLLESLGEGGSENISVGNKQSYSSKEIIESIIFQCKSDPKVRSKVDSALAEFNTTYPGRLVKPPDIRVAPDMDILTIRVKCYKRTEMMNIGENLLKTLKIKC